MTPPTTTSGAAPPPPTTNHGSPVVRSDGAAPLPSAGAPPLSGVQEGVAGAPVSSSPASAATTNASTATTNALTATTNASTATTNSMHSLSAGSPPPPTLAEALAEAEAELAAHQASVDRALDIFMAAESDYQLALHDLRETLATTAQLRMLVDLEARGLLYASQMFANAGGREAMVYGGDDSAASAGPGGYRGPADRGALRSAGGVRA